MRWNAKLADKNRGKSRNGLDRARPFCGSAPRDRSDTRFLILIIGI